MPADEQDSDETPGSPNPRRDEWRPPPLIEGAAEELPSAPPETSAVDPLSADGESAAPPPKTREDAPRASVALAALVLAALALLAAGSLWLRPFFVAPQDLAERQTAALTTQIDALRDRVAALETTAKSAGADAQRALAAASAAQAAAAEATHVAAARPVAAVASAAPDESSGLAALDKRLGSLEQRPDPSAANARLAADVSDLSHKTAGLSDALADLGKRVSDLDGRVGAQSARLTPLEALLQAPKIDVAAVNASTTQAVDAAQAAALIVVARSLQQSLDAGAPYAPALAAAAKLGADPVSAKFLQASAASGVATKAELSQSFSQLVGPILAGVDSSERGGVLDRLAREAGRLVQIRSVGQTTGDSPAAVVGRIESALDKGDLAAALRARDLLPESAKTISEDWAKRARARLVAEQAAQALAADAMTRLGKART